MFLVVPYLYQKNIDYLIFVRLSLKHIGSLHFFNFVLKKHESCRKRCTLLKFGWQGCLPSGCHPCHPSAILLPSFSHPSAILAILQPSFSHRVRQPPVASCQPFCNFCSLCVFDFNYVFLFFELFLYVLYVVCTIFNMFYVFCMLSDIFMCLASYI